MSSHRDRAAARRRAIEAAYRAGASISEVAAQFGIHRNSLAVNLHRWGIKLPEDERRRRYAEGHRKSAAARAASMRGRPQVWPDCPPHLLSAYETLRLHYPAREARAMLEGQA